jgi:hypothetical protein
MTTATFLGLPRELRNLIYDEVFKGCRKPRSIERRNLTNFTPAPVNILLVLNWACLLINTQVAAEALEILFKKHVVLLLCGPSVLNSFLYRIGQDVTGTGKELLQSLKHVELDWLTFPNLRYYPGREQNRLSCGDHDMETSSPYSDEEGITIEAPTVDYEGESYDDDDHDYAHSGSHQHWPAHRINDDSTQSSAADPFGLLSHYPFADPSGESTTTYSAAAEERMFSNLEYMIYREVTPLFHYLSSPTFFLSSMTLPLYFIKREQYQTRIRLRPAYALPLKVRYWVHVIAHALLLLHPPHPSTIPKLNELRVLYKPKNIWASLDPCDDLGNMCENGVWGANGGSGFRAVWDEFERLRGMTDTEELDVKVKLMRGGSNVYDENLGDELEVIIKR